MLNDQDIPSLQDRRMAARLVRSSSKCRGDSDGNIFRRFPKTAKAKTAISCKKNQCFDFKLVRTVQNFFTCFFAKSFLYIPTSDGESFFFISRDVTQSKRTVTTVGEFVSISYKSRYRSVYR